MTKRRRGRPPSSSPKPTAISAEQREAVIKDLREGSNYNSVVALAGLAGEPWDAEIEAAFRFGLAKLSTKKLKLALMGHSGPALADLREEVERRERTLAAKRVAAPADGAMSEWLALFDQLDDGEELLAHSLVSGDISQFRASLRCMVVERAVELTRDPDWLASINTRWAEAIRATMQPKPEPRRVDEIEVLDADEVIPPDKSIVPFRSPLAGSAPYNPPRTTLNHPMARR